MIYSRIAGGLTLLGLLTACGPDEPELREVVRPIKTFVFGDASSRTSFDYPGRVFANRTVDVGFEVPGKLAQLPVVRGMQVSKGNLLAQLDQRDFVNALSAAQAHLDEANATYERFKVAAATNAIPKQQLDEAFARREVAEAQLKIQEKALEDSSIRADFDGIVANRFVENFDNVIAKQPIVSLQDIAQLEIRINIPESDVARAGGSQGDVRAGFSAVPGREFELTVKEFATEADPVTQTFLVTLLMPNPEDVDVLPGMTATVRWTPESQGGGSLLVPAVAVGGMAGDKPWVWVFDASTNTVKRREVQVGQLVQDDKLEIRGGLERGDTIAKTGIYHLDENMKVRPL